MNQRLRVPSPGSLALLSVILVGGVLSSPAQAENHRHHIQVGAGYAKLLSDDVKEPAAPADFSDSGLGVVAYRYSISPLVDVTVDGRSTFSSKNVAGIDLSLTNGWFGPGIRVTAPGEGMRPYGQASFFVVNESAEAAQGNVKVSRDETGVGFGVMGGFDIRASRLISIPLEMSYMYGKPSDNVSAVGFTAGITFNFGQMPD